MHKQSVYIFFSALFIVGAIATVKSSTFKQEGPQEGEKAGEIRGTVIGRVLLGPTCPVVSDPPDPECADQPYATSLALTTPDGAHAIKTFASDLGGTFRVEAPSGHYAIRSAVAANILPYCQSNGAFEVPPNDSVDVVVSCDTGIR